jgi:hypothetical protein
MGAASILTIERLHELFEPDYEAGLLRWRVNRSRARAGAVAGCVQYDRRHGLYRRAVKIDGRLYRNARLLWTMFNDRFPPESTMIDHTDGDPLHDCIWNLRAATPSENLRNRSGANRNSVSGHRGVYYYKRTGRWRAYIKVDGKEIHLGLFDTEEEAISVAEAARLKHYGAFAEQALTPGQRVAALYLDSALPSKAA